MATRFMHYILAWEGVSARNFPRRAKGTFFGGLIVA